MIIKVKEKYEDLIRKGTSDIFSVIALSSTYSENLINVFLQFKNNTEILGF